MRIGIQATPGGCLVMVTGCTRPTGAMLCIGIATLVLSVTPVDARACWCYFCGGATIRGCVVDIREDVDIDHAESGQWVNIKCGSDG